MASKKKLTNKIHPHLWYNNQAREAAEFYCSVFPDSKIDRVSTLPSDSPSGPAGSVEIVEFTLFGQPFMGVQRSAFLIGEDGKVEKAWPAISPKDTPTNLLAALADG